MLSENIKEYRLKNNLTQKDLADKLFITPQAISRWENGDTDPSASSLVSMANIFGITVDELLGNNVPKSDPPEPEVIIKTETVYKDAPPPVLAICSVCKSPIYSSSDLVETRVSHGRSPSTTSYQCKKCDAKLKKKRHDEAVAHGIACRKRSFIISGIVTAILLAIWLGVSINYSFPVGAIIGGSFASLLFFPFLSCIFLENNFVPYMCMSVFTFGFIKFPGLIFSLDLDGIIWLLTVKLAFWIIGFAVAAVFFVLALTLGLITSIFVYPFALKINFDSPEKSSL